MSTVHSDQAAILLLDLQEGTMARVKTISGHRLRRAAGALAKLSALHGMPAFISSIPQAGAFSKRVLAPLSDRSLRPRNGTSAFGDPSFVGAVGASGRKTLLLAGVASEIVVLRTALDAIDAGYEVQILVDACGGFSDRTEAAAWSRATAHGAILNSVVTVAAEVAGDITSDSGKASLALVYEAAGQ